jgi:hypothetical protein
MTREILLPATSGRIPSPSLIYWIAIDRAMRLAISVTSAKARAVLHLERDARGKAEANLALCGEVDAVLTPAHPGRLRSSQRRTAKNHPIFRNSRRPRGGLGALHTRQYAGRHRVCRRVRWSHRLSADAAEILGLRIAGVLPREGAMIAQTLSLASGVNQSGAHAAGKVESQALLASSRERFLLPTGRPPSRERENRQILRRQWVRGSVALPALSRK